MKKMLQLELSLLQLFRKTKRQVVAFPDEMMNYTTSMFVNFVCIKFSLSKQNRYPFRERILRITVLLLLNKNWKI
jgi:hypothetical protein